MQMRICFSTIFELSRAPRSDRDGMERRLCIGVSDLLAASITELFQFVHRELRGICYFSCSWQFDRINMMIDVRKSPWVYFRLLIVKTTVTYASPLTVDGARGKGLIQPRSPN